MNSTQLNLAVANVLSQASRLRAREREVHLLGNALVENIQMGWNREHRLDHMQVVHLLNIHFAKALRQKVGLLLVIALDVHLVPRANHRLQKLYRITGLDHLSVHHVRTGSLETLAVITLKCVPRLRFRH